MRGNAKEIHFSIKKLPSLTKIHLSGVIDETIVTSIFEQVPYIQKLHLNGNLLNFKLGNFVNLKQLILDGEIGKDFNFELFENLCNQLEDIKIRLFNIDEKTLFKLFDGFNFPYLVDLTIEYIKIKRLTKEIINRLPTHRRLNECI